MAGRLHPEDLVAGALFYECHSGMNLEAVCMTSPVEGEGVSGRKSWSWTARNTQTGDPVDYRITEGLEHYGPRLYSEPQYAMVENGSFVFPLLGGEVLDTDRDTPGNERDPETLGRWAEEFGTLGSAVPVREWLETPGPEARAENPDPKI